MIHMFSVDSTQFFLRIFSMEMFDKPFFVDGGQTRQLKYRKCSEQNIHIEHNYFVTSVKVKTLICSRETEIKHRGDVALRIHKQKCDRQRYWDKLNE